MSDESFRTKCANLTSKFSNIADNGDRTNMKEIKVESKSEERLNCSNSKIVSNSNENDSCKSKNSPINSTESCTTSRDSCNETQDRRNNENESHKSHILYQERYDRFQEFKKIEKSLCHDLGMATKYDRCDILSPKRMEKCRKDLQKLYLLKKKRQLHYSEIIDEIKALLSEMDIYTWSDFEKSALSTQFAVSRENLNALHAWKHRLLEQLEHEQKAVEEMKCKIATLWDKLSVDVRTRQDFLSRTFTKQSRKYVLKDLQMEVHRCQKLWKQKIRHEILHTRKEIIDLWVECHVGQKQRERFVAFNSEIFDEELLNAHQQEINRLKQQYQETIELNKLVLKWSNLRSKLNEMEIQSKSMKKFNNRGGSLLKDEKELKICQKNVSILESKIMHLAAKYKTDYGTHFHFNGRPISQIIDELRKSNIKTEKENQVKSQSMPVQKRSTALKSQENISLLKNIKLKNNIPKSKISSLGNFSKSLKI